MCCLPPPPLPPITTPFLVCKIWPSSAAVRTTGAGDSAQDVSRRQVPPPRQPVTVYAGTVRHGDPILERKYTRSRSARPLWVAGVEYDRVNPTSWRCTMFGIGLSAVHAPIYLASSVCLISLCVVWICGRKGDTEHSPQIMRTGGAFLRWIRYWHLCTHLVVLVYPPAVPPFPPCPLI